MRRYKRRAIPRAKHLDPEHWAAKVVNLLYSCNISLINGQNIVLCSYRPYRPLRKSLLVSFAAFTRLKSGHTSQEERS